VTHEVRRRTAVCYVALDGERAKIAGYYTLVLLWDAGLRAMRSELAVFALVVEAKDEQAASFYRHHGFVAFDRRPRQFVLPLSKLAEAARSGTP
jgi:hypothetical protein